LTRDVARFDRVASSFNAPVVLGLDPGFSFLGAAVVEIQPRGERVLALELVRTAKESKKRQVLAADDNVRRAREICASLQAIVSDRKPVLFACESMSFPRNSSVAAKMALGWGVVAAVAQLNGIPIVQVSPQSMKKRLCGVHNATKEQLEEALVARYGEKIIKLFDGPKGQREHPMDALGAIVACLESEPCRMARMMVTA